MIGETLLAAALRGSIVLLVAGIAVTLLRSRPAALRHTIWSLAIASQLALPIATLLMPQQTIDLGPIGASITRAMTSVVAAARTSGGGGEAEAGKREARESVPADQSSPTGAGSLRAADQPTGAAQASAQQTPSASNSQNTPADFSGAIGFLTLLWGVGAFLMLVRFGIGTVLVARETRRANRPISREWVLLAGQIQDEMNLQRDAALLWGTRREVPYTWGILSPVVCLPSDADKWSIDRLRIVMIHELAHVERFDTFGEFIAQLALVIFWFNPLLWLAVRRMRTEREHACDDRVLMRGVKPSTYVEELVMMMKSIGSGSIAPGFGAIAMAQRTQFEARMFAVLDERADRHAVGRRSIFGAALGMIALLLVVASVRPVSASAATRGQAATAVPTLPPSHGIASAKAVAWPQSDFDEMVADCKNKKSKGKPDLGVRYCEVRTVDLSALTGAIDFRGDYLDGAIFTTKGSPRAPSARALIRADALTPEDARKLAAQVKTVLKDGVLESAGPGGNRSNLWSVLYEVTLPVGRSVTARTELSQISLTDFDGSADVESVNGPVEVFGASGDIRGRTQNGPIIVGLAGNQWSGAGLDLRSQNGPISLRIPDGYSAHLVTGTNNGPLDLRYPLMVKRMSGKGIDADIGSGGPTVRVTTVNGPVDIR
jgi:beta-lactamase regulating signal transducer with metallopeptidase domain